MTKIQIRRDTSANWKTNNPVLAAGELALETDTMLMKVGDGSSSYLNLSYQNGSNECINDIDGNFNNYTKEGCYFINAKATIQNGPTSSSGIPLNGGFYLMVYNRSALVPDGENTIVLHLQLAFAQGIAWNPIQDYTQLNGQLFIRTFHGGSGGLWTPWLEVTTNFILKDLLVAGDNIQLDVDKTTGKITINSTAPTNMVTTDTEQTITGLKNFQGGIAFQNTSGGASSFSIMGDNKSNFSIGDFGYSFYQIILDASNKISLKAPTVTIGDSGAQVTNGDNQAFINTGNFATLAPTGALKYWTGTEAVYTELGTKDADTLYRTTDTNKVYLGTIQIGGQ